MNGWRLQRLLKRCKTNVWRVVVRLPYLTEPLNNQRNEEYEILKCDIGTTIKCDIVDNPQNITCHTNTQRCPTLQGDLGPWQPCDVSHSSTPILIQSTPSSSPSLSLCEHSAAYPIVAAKTSFQNPITAIGFLRIAANTNSQQTACTQNFRKPHF